MSSSEYESAIEDFSSNESESDVEEINEMLVNLQPYHFEPEDDSDGEETSDESSEGDPSDNDIPGPRVGNKEWCKCGYCKKETRQIDSLCCIEVPAIDEEKFEGKKCITLAEEFNLLCGNKTVLKNVLVSLHETRGDPLEKEAEIKNQSIRFAACKQFIWWVFQRLGKGNRRVIPSCVVWNIRKKFPEATGQYTRFKEGERD